MHVIIYTWTFSYVHTYVLIKNLKLNHTVLKDINFINDIIFVILLFAMTTCA